MRNFTALIKHNFNFQAGSLILLSIILYGLLLNNLNLWTDEIYSVLMAKDSLKEMFHLLLTEDSKPPLYYLYLKGILNLFPLKYEIFGAHFGSYLILILTQVFAAVEVRKDFGEKVSLWFIGLTMLMPHSLWLALEVRTYMLSAFLMFAALIYALRLLRTPQKNDYFKLGICSVAALYSHYYCALWLMFLYGSIFSILFYKKNFIELKKLLLTALIVAILFSPWLTVPLTTAGKISQYWYVSSDFVKLSPMFFYDPLAPDILQSIYYIATYFSAMAFTFVVFCGVFEYYKKEPQTAQAFYIAFGTFMLTYLLLLILSYTIRPMVTSRYLKIFSLIWYFAGACVLAHEKILQKVFLCFGIIGFVFSYLDVRYVSFDKGYQNIVNDIRKFIPKNEPIATLDNSNLFCEYYLPEYKNLLISDPNGEVLRIPSVAENYKSYTAKSQNQPIIVLSMMTKISNPQRCKFYPSGYRFANGGVHLCYHRFEDVNHLMEKFVRIKFHKSGKTLTY